MMLWVGVAIGVVATLIVVGGWVVYNLVKSIGDD
jgi:hypothetical protein